MAKRRYGAPILFDLDDGGDVTVIGQGTGQGTNIPEAMTYEEWWTDIAREGDNPDADYNGDGVINEDDYNYYMDNELWNG